MSRIEAGTQAAQAMQVAVSNSSHDAVPAGRTSTSRPAPQASNPTSPTATTTIRVSVDFAQMQSINDRQNRVATRMRQDDQQLHESDQLLGQMKRMLFRIIKNYPPYPPGEPERVKYLRSFNGLRQQIEQLTIPPERKWTDIGADAAPSASAAVPTAGPAGAATTLGIPELQDMADDAQIDMTLNVIDTAQTAISGQRAAIEEQAARINRADGYGAKAVELNRSSSGAWDLIVPAADQAEQKSSEARSSLVQTADLSITDTAVQPLLQSLAG